MSLPIPLPRRAVAAVAAATILVAGGAVTASAAVPAAPAVPQYSAPTVAPSAMNKDVRAMTAVMKHFAASMKKVAKKPSQIKALAPGMRADLKKLDTLRMKMASYSVTDKKLDARRRKLVVALAPMVASGNQLVAAMLSGKKAPMKKALTRFQMATLAVAKAAK